MKPLFTQCELLTGQKHGIAWGDVCTWYLSCSEVPRRGPWGTAGEMTAGKAQGGTHSKALPRVLCRGLVPATLRPQGQDVRPYLPQRIPRHVYLELLLRAAHKTHRQPPQPTPC